MRELKTIQTKERLNRVFVIDEEGPGGANHAYAITRNDGNYTEAYESCGYPPMDEIFFQKGPRKEENSKHGVIDSDLLEIVRDRYKAFQEGPFASEYNEKALFHIEEALKWMNKRVEDRISRNVLGKNEK